jgi:diaminohydroxyphosphoribosylaminopyrimidine deaminase / 5-amino-6-(5-phosphoribosylamino)uracil reductase
MQRCFDLARLGLGQVSPNPLVGAVLVYENRIIGEGWHQKYGGPHAEVHCVQSVDPALRHLIPRSTLYCSLEPCFHFGKTPPCVELILREKIPHVVIANTDPNPLTAGKSIAKLRAAGVRITDGVLAQEGADMNRPFFTWITQKRPYIRLKWAQSADAFLSKKGERTTISGPTVQRWVHRWRMESDAILVGTRTAVIDNPRLDNRLYWGKSPLRITFDRQMRIPPDHHILDDSTPTWILGPTRAGRQWQQTLFFQEEEMMECRAAKTVSAQQSHFIGGRRRCTFAKPDFCGTVG